MRRPPDSSKQARPPESKPRAAKSDAGRAVDEDPILGTEGGAVKAPPENASAFLDSLRAIARDRRPELDPDALERVVLGGAYRILQELAR